LGVFYGKIEVINATLAPLSHRRGEALKLSNKGKSMQRTPAIQGKDKHECSLVPDSTNVGNGPEGEKQMESF